MAKNEETAPKEEQKEDQKEEEIGEDTVGALPNMYHPVHDLTLYDVLNHPIPEEVKITEIVRQTKAWASMKQRGIRIANDAKQGVVDYLNRIVQIGIEHLWGFLPKISRGKNKGLPKRLTLKKIDFEIAAKDLTESIEEKKLKEKEDQEKAESEKKVKKGKGKKEPAAETPAETKKETPAETKKETKKEEVEEIDYDAEQIDKNTYLCAFCAYADKDPKEVKLDKKKITDHLKTDHKVKDPVALMKDGKKIKL